MASSAANAGGAHLEGLVVERAHQAGHGLVVLGASSPSAATAAVRRCRRFFFPSASSSGRRDSLPSSARSPASAASRTCSSACGEQLFERLLRPRVARRAEEGRGLHLERVVGSDAACDASMAMARASL